MASFTRYIRKMADGTIKQVSPFTGTEVWTVPGRGQKPISNKIPKDAVKLQKRARTDEDYCNFCFQKLLNTPPEKSRIVKDENGNYKKLERVAAENISDTFPLFRRISNLFEIVSYNYWEMNYKYTLNESLREWKANYLSSDKGREHILNVIDLKLRISGKDPDTISIDEKLDRLANPFFGGAHEVIIGGKHFIDDAEYSSQLFSSGEFTPEEHYQYIKFTIDSCMDIYENNKYVRYISVFQNWLAPAGASFDHLHKQLVGLDEWGVSIEREIELLRNNRNLYNEYATNYAYTNDLFLCENDFGIAIADFGHRHPTVAIYSKSVNPRPSQHTKEELRGMSDILHAIHCATGSSISCNEEWYYSPQDAIEVMPWHILIKWRTNNPAGFEGGTKIYINPMSPMTQKDIILPRLFEMRDKNRIAKDLRLGNECKSEFNCLKYYKYRS